MENKVSFKKLAYFYCFGFSALSIGFWTFVFVECQKNPEFGMIGLLDVIPSAIFGIAIMILEPHKIFPSGIYSGFIMIGISLFFWNIVGLLAASTHLMVKDK